MHLIKLVKDGDVVCGVVCYLLVFKYTVYFFSL